MIVWEVTTGNTTAYLGTNTGEATHIAHTLHHAGHTTIITAHERR